MAHRQSIPGTQLYRRLRLVPDEEYAQMKQQRVLKEYDPRLAGMVAADDSRKRAMSQVGPFEAREQLLRHHHALDQFRHLKADISTPLASTKPLTETELTEVRSVPSTSKSEHESELVAQQERRSVINNDTVDTILESVPMNQRKKAAQLLKHLQRHPAVFAVAPNFELSLSGTELDGSNIVDLIRSLYLSPAAGTGAPPYIAEFTAALRQVNTPHAYLSKHALSLLQHSAAPQVGEGLSRAGRVPHSLSKTPISLFVRSLVSRPPGRKGPALHSFPPPSKLLKVYRDV